MERIVRTWPAAVARYLTATHGEPLAREPLGGMSGGSVERVRFAATSVIVKASPNRWERQFYRHAAGALARSGVATPRLYWSAQLHRAAWLVLEDLPHLLPRTRWTADVHMLTLLARLHQLSDTTITDLPDRYVPRWTDQMTADAVSCFPATVATTLAPLLHTLQRASAHVFAPWCTLSGDPNPTNWGQRADGTLVLFDWERFSRGTPALDLAITVPGLGEPATFERVASTYRRVWRPDARPLPWTAAHLSRDIAYAKVWSVVELLSMYATGHGAIPDQMVDTLREQVPRWVTRLHHELR